MRCPLRKLAKAFTALFAEQTQHYGARGSSLNLKLPRALSIPLFLLATAASRFERSERRCLMGTSGRVLEDAKLKVRVEQDGEALVVRAFGELDLSNAKTLEAELRRAIGGDASEVILDLGGVSFIDLAALRGLLLMAKQSLRNGGRLRLLRATTPEERSRFQRLREGVDGRAHQTNTRSIRYRPAVPRSCPTVTPRAFRNQGRELREQFWSTSSGPAELA
jgi:anti-anti-sigma factor